MRMDLNFEGHQDSLRKTTGLKNFKKIINKKIRRKYRYRQMPEILFVSSEIGIGTAIYLKQVIVKILKK